MTLNVLLAGGGIWFAYIFLPARPFSNEEVNRLKTLANQQSNANVNPRTPAAAPLSAEEVKGFKEDVSRYLEWVIAIAGIFTIAQTIAAGFAAQSFTRQAERDVNELNEFKKDYRVLALAGQAQQTAFDVLKNALEAYLGKDWLVDRRGDFYAGMSVVERQTILSADRYLGYDLLLYQGREPDSTLGVLHSEWSKLRGLAIFYVSKYEHEQKLRSGQWQDLERAHHLLQSGIQNHSSDFQLHNDLGVVLIKCADHCREIDQESMEVDFREKARAEFLTSACLQRKQQRAYFNLSRIACDAAKPPEWPKSSATETAAFKEGLLEAVRQSKLAYDMANWETKPNEAMKKEIAYNLACYRALFCFCEVKECAVGTADFAIAEQNANPVIEGLKEVAGPGKDQGTILRRYVEKDFDQPEGDLYGFRSRLSPADLARLDELKEGLWKAAQE